MSWCARVPPVLFAEAAARSGIRLLNECRVDELDQDSCGARALGTDLKSGARFAVHAQYVVGCDGGRSLARKVMSISSAVCAYVQIRSRPEAPQARRQMRAPRKPPRSTP